MSESKTLEERVIALECAQVRRGKWVDSYCDDLYKHALAFANLKAFCSTIEPDGTRNVHCKTEADEMMAYHSRQMEVAAVRLLREMAIEEPK